MNNVKATNLSIKDTNNKVRVQITGTTAITNTKVESGAKLEATASSFGAIELAPVAANQNIELVGVNEVVTITKPVVVISATPVTTKIEAGVKVTLKAVKDDEGIKVEGTGGDAVAISPSEVNSVMGQLKDNMFDDVVYPGRGENTYTLSSMVSEKVKELTKNGNIKLTVGNSDTDYGYYKVTLTIAGATASKLIKVDTVTVDSVVGLKDALTFNINKVILKANGSFTFTEPLHINKRVITIEGNGNSLIINSGASNTGNDSAAGLGIFGDNVTLRNMTVTGDHNDNLIEIYSNATLENVTVTGGKKAGIYVNNDKTGTIEVDFNGVHTSNNGWKAGIGLVAQKVDSKIIANFSGVNTFGEDVAVYTDDSTKYKGGYTVEGLVGYTKTTVGNQQKWMKEVLEAKITSIKSITEEVEVDAAYTLPSEVEATMSDNSKKNIAVTWNPTAAVTSEAGAVTYTGTVEGFNGEVTLTLTVKAKDVTEPIVEAPTDGLKELSVTDLTNEVEILENVK